MNIINKLLVSLALVVFVKNYRNCNENDLQTIKKLSIVSITNTKTEHTFENQILHDKDWNVLYDPNRNGENYTWFSKNYRTDTNSKIVPQYNGRDIYWFESWSNGSFYKTLLSNAIAISNSSDDHNVYGIYALNIPNNLIHSATASQIQVIFKENADKKYDPTLVSCWKVNKNKSNYISSFYNKNHFHPKDNNGNLLYCLNEFTYTILNPGNIGNIEDIKWCTLLSNSGRSVVDDYIQYWQKNDQVYIIDPNNSNNIIPQYQKSDGTYTDIYTLNDSNLSNTIFSMKSVLVSNTSSINELLKWHKEEIKLFHLWNHEIRKRVNEIELREEELDKKEKELKKISNGKEKNNKK